MRPESKVLSKLENEVEWLQGEKRQLEAHLTRTEIWAENLGRWVALVQSAEVCLIGPLFQIKLLHVKMSKLLQIVKG